MNQTTLIISDSGSHSYCVFKQSSSLEPWKQNRTEHNNPNGRQLTILIIPLINTLHDILPQDLCHLFRMRHCLCQIWIFGAHGCITPECIAHLVACCGEDVDIAWEGLLVCASWYVDVVVVDDGRWLEGVLGWQCWAEKSDAPVPSGVKKGRSAVNIPWKANLVDLSKCRYAAKDILPWLCCFEKLGSPNFRNGCQLDLINNCPLHLLLTLIRNKRFCLMRMMSSSMQRCLEN